ncbi:MAG: hypothetical protein Q9212_002604 [Teloschistes hypoglaucus]
MSTASSVKSLGRLQSYSNITHLGAHDSPFLRDASTNYSLSGNQDLDTKAQLDAGVRLLSAQVRNSNGAWHLCHTSCSLLDAGTLSSWLAEIKGWLDRNPYDVVTLLLVNSDNAAASDLDGEFEAAAIKPYAYTMASNVAPPSSWPTLNELILSRKRLVTFVADIVATDTTSYLLNEFTFVFENPYSVTSLSNFSCTPERPLLVQGHTSTAIQSGRLPLVNHFLDIQTSFGLQVPDLDDISITNALSGLVGNLGDAAAECTAVYGKPPTFLLVDFFDQGSAIGTVDKLNGITPVGRAGTGNPSTPESTQAVSAFSSTGSLSSRFFKLIVATSAISNVFAAA